MKQRFVNNFSTTVASTFGAADVFLNLTSVTGLPALGASEYIALTIYRQVGVVESGHEVVHVTAIVGNQATVTRSVEGADATVFVAGDRVQARVTAAALESKADFAELTKANVGLGNVSNLAPADMPVSTAQQTALNLKANQSTTYTKTETDAAIAAVVDAAPTQLNTLNELAAALGDDANFAASVTTALAGKASNVNASITGSVTILGTTDASLVMSRPAGNYGAVRLQTALVNRWFFGASNTAESGSNAGSNFFINSYNDAGTLLETCMSIIRSTGVAEFTHVPKAEGTPLVTRTAAETLTNKTFVNPVVTNYTETVYSPAAGSSFTVDLANGSYQRFTTNANTTITLPAAVAGKSYVIEIVFGGAHTVTINGGTLIKWPGGTTPTPTSVSGKRDKYVFVCPTSATTDGIDGGRNY